MAEVFREGNVEKRGSANLTAGAPLIAFFAMSGFRHNPTGSRSLKSELQQLTVGGMTQGLHRYYGSNDLHFITCSCYHREPVLRPPQRRDLFLDTLEETRLRYHFVLVGFVIMPEHLHLLNTEPETGDPSVVMKVLKERFTRKLRTAGAPLIAPFAMSGIPCPRTRSGLAEAVLRFQRVDRRETHREASLHAPQPGEARIGGAS